MIKKKILISITEDVKNEISLEAKKLGFSFSAYVSMILIEHVKNKKGE